MIKQVVRKTYVVLHLLVYTGAILTPVVAHADARDLLFPFYSAVENGCSTTPTTPTQANSTSKSLYMLGDSLTEGMKGSGDISAKFTAKGWSVGKIEAMSGWSVADLLPNVDADKDIIANAGAVVIALGTNSVKHKQLDSTKAAFTTVMDSMVTKIRGYAPKTKIYWVNAYATKTGLSYTNTNAVIAETSLAGKVSLIDWATEATGNAAKYPFAPDGIHMNTAGYVAKAEFVSNAVGAPAVSGDSSTNTSTTTGYDPTILTYPNFPDEAVLAKNIDDYVRKIAPSSPWLTIPNLGNWIVTESKSRGMNPMIIMASGKQENVYGTSGTNPKRNNNYFGIKGSNGYIHYDTPLDGMVAFLDAMKRNVIDKSHANYKDVTNIYEYLSVHQTGGIHYPGDGLSLGDPDDPSKYISWDTQYNPGVYWKTTADVISKLTGLTISPEVPPKGSGFVSSGCGGTSTNAQTSGDASKYIPDCNANSGNAAIACTAINQLIGIPYSIEARAAAPEPAPKFLDCSALVNMAIYRTFSKDLGGMCSAQFLSNANFQTIDVHSIQAGDMVGSGAACGGPGHIAIVVSYDASTKKLITVETGSTKRPSGLRGIGGANGYNVGLKADGGNGDYAWAVRYIGPKSTQAEAQ